MPPSSAFLQGVLVPWRGFLFLMRRPTLWRYGVIPLVLNLFITTFVAVSFLGGVAALLVWLHPYYPDGWLGVVLEVVSGAGLLLASLAVALGVWKFLEGVLCGWFYYRLARNIERKLGLAPEELADVPWGKQIVDTGAEVATLLAINLGFLALHLIPVLGSIVGTAGGLYFDCWLLGKDYLSYPLDLRGRRRAEKVAFAKRHRGQTLGLGAAVLLFNFVPLLGPVLLTTAVAGSVLLHRELEKAPAAA
jgi:CysZ protein